MTKATIFIDEKGVVQVTDDGASIKAAFAAMEPPPVGHKVLALVPATTLSSQEAEIEQLRTALLDARCTIETCLEDNEDDLAAIDAALTPLPEGGNG